MFFAAGGSDGVAYTGTRDLTSLESFVESKLDLESFVESKLDIIMPEVSVSFAVLFLIFVFFVLLVLSLSK